MMLLTKGLFFFLLALTESHGTNGGMTEDDGRDVIVVHRGLWLVVKQSMGQLPPCSNSNCREREREREREGEYTDEHAT